MGLFGNGTCNLTCVLEKDMLYPRELISLQIYVDNSLCKRKIDKYTVRFVRRVQLLNGPQVVYLNDQIIHE